MQAPLKSGGFYGIVSCWEYAVECNSVQHLHVHMLFWLARFGSLFRRFNNQTSKEAREAREKLAAELQKATEAAMRDLGIYEAEVTENPETPNLDLPNPAFFFFFLLERVQRLKQVLRGPSVVKRLSLPPRA